VFAHCFTCSKDTKAAACIARALAEAGFGVLRLDFTGLGGSGGDFGNTDFSSNVDDLVAAANWLRAAHGAPALRRRKQWPLEYAHVTLTHDKIHGAECAECETKAGRVDRIERAIGLVGPLDEVQRARLMEIADQCPVHRTLHSELRVVTRPAWPSPRSGPRGRRHAVKRLRTFPTAEP
jgi:hypothetical protein